MNTNLRIVRIQLDPMPPQQESFIGRSANWLFGRTVQQLDTIYFVDTQNNKTNSGLTKRDIQNYCHQQGGFTFAKYNIVNNFIDQLTGREDLSETEKKCFCNWLLAVGDVEIARKITFDKDMAPVRERDNDYLRGFIECVVQKHSYILNYIEQRDLFMNFIINSSSSKIFDSELSVEAQSVLKRLVNSSVYQYAPLFLERIFSTEYPSRILYHLNEWDTALLGTLVGLGPTFLDKLFSAQGSESIIENLVGWDPSSLFGLKRLNPTFLDKLFSGKNPGRIIQSLTGCSFKYLDTLVNLNPIFLDKLFSLKDPRPIIDQLKLWGSDQLGILANLNPIFLDKLFSLKDPLPVIEQLELVIPALYLLTNYCGLPKDLNFVPLLDELSKINWPVSNPISYEVQVFRVIVKVMIDYLVKQDPNIPQSLQNEINTLLISKGSIFFFSRSEADLGSIRDLCITLAKIKERKEPIHLNYIKLFNDLDINSWNNLKTIPVISENEWKDLETRLGVFLKKVFPEDKDKEKCDNIWAFFTKAMESSDAKTPAGKVQVRQRVASIIDYLLSLNPDDLQLKDITEMLDFGGGACPDRVMVTIDQAEMYVKFQLAGEEYQANVSASAFKRKGLDRLINPNQAENIETYLYYLITLNSVLQLGLPADTKMLYEGCAQRKPWIQVFPRLFLGFTPDDFISFVADNSFLQKQWKELSDYKGAMELLTKKREDAINAVNASDEEIGAYLKKEWGLEEDDFPTDEQIEIEKNNRQKELVGLKTFLLDKIAKVYEKAGFVMPRDTVNEEEARAAFIQKKKADEAQNITKWNKQLIIVQALSRQLSNLIAVIPAEGIGKADFQMLVDKNKELQVLMEQRQDADLGASLGVFANRINLLLSKENENETIKKGDFTRTSTNLQMQENTIKQSLQKSIQAYGDEINKLSEELKAAKKMYEGRSLTPDEEALYYGKQQALSNAVQIGEQNFFKTQAQQLLLESGYLVSSEQ